MALETKPAKDPAAEDKHELDPKRKAALDTALAQVEKSFGKGSAMRLGDQPEQNVEVIPTGSLALDMALGIGGLPKGRIVEIYGPESSGKTTLALHVLAQAQKAVRSVRVTPELLDYIGALCEKTRALDDALLGASPRAALALMRVSQSLAAIRGRDYVTPEDIKTMAEPVLAHRLILRTAYGRRGRAAEAVGEVLASVPVPTETIE